MNEEEQQLFELLYSKFPGFSKHWDVYKDNEIKIFGVNEFDPSVYEVAQEFSEYLVHAYQEEDFSTLELAFSTIEDQANNSSEYISEVVMVGIVEGVLMLRSHKHIPLDAFDKWLGKSSKDFWYGMHDYFTSGDNNK